MKDKDIREAAQDFLDRMSGCSKGKEAMIYYRDWGEFSILKAALKPSKEEVADYLNDFDNRAAFFSGNNGDEFGEMLNQAIDYLREATK